MLIEAARLTSTASQTPVPLSLWPNCNPRHDRRTVWGVRRLARVQAHDWLLARRRIRAHTAGIPAEAPTYEATRLAHRISTTYERIRDALIEARRDQQHTPRHRA